MEIRLQTDSRGEGSEEEVWVDYEWSRGMYEVKKGKRSWRMWWSSQITWLVFRGTAPISYQIL